MDIFIRTEHHQKKYNNNRAHVKRRYLERFHRKLTNEDYDTLCNLCVDRAYGYNDHRRKDKGSRDYRKTLVFKNEVLVCIYSRKHKAVVTVYQLTNDFERSLILLKYNNKKNEST